MTACMSVRRYFRLLLLLWFFCRFPVGRTTRRMLQFISAAKIDTMRGRGGSDDHSCKEILSVGVGWRECVCGCVLLLGELGQPALYLCICFSVFFTCDGECNVVWKA